MKKFAFVSDFDNTISQKDFYHMLIDNYLGEKGREFYIEWKKTKKINVEFLNKIFEMVNLTEEELKQNVLQIPLDKNALELIKSIKKSGQDFYIVSAGTSYYIEIILRELGINDVGVVSMKGIYEDGKLVIHKDKKSPYYSEDFGLDKAKVIESMRSNYEKIYFSGDSEPDLGASKAADVRFAKEELAELLERDGVEFIRYNDFGDIIRWLIDNGDLSAIENKTVHSAL